MTRQQAEYVLGQIAGSNGSASVAIYLNGVGKAFVGRATYLPDAGLISLDGNRVFVRPEQVAAIAIAQDG